MVAYAYAADRKGERAESRLGDFAGILQVDGFGGYATLAEHRQQVSLAFCWAHVWTTSAAQELFGIDDFGRVHPCVRPVRAAPHGCWA